MPFRVCFVSACHSRGLVFPSQSESILVHFTAANKEVGRGVFESLMAVSVGGISLVVVSPRLELTPQLSRVREGEESAVCGDFE